MRTDDDQVGMPRRGGIDQALPDVAYLDRGVCFESCTSQLLRNAPNQLIGWLFLALQLWSVTRGHFRRLREGNGLQHMKNQDLG
ncbi:MAG: hypothetical protein WBD32_07410, partial [Acidobacteriaceae bacterium]